MATEAPIDLKWGKWCLHLFSVTFDPVLFILVGNEDTHKISDRHKIWDEFELWPDRTTDYGVTAFECLKNFPIDF